MLNQDNNPSACNLFIKESSIEDLTPDKGSQREQAEQKYSFTHRPSLAPLGKLRNVIISQFIPDDSKAEVSSNAPAQSLPGAAVFGHQDLRKEQFSQPAGGV